MGVNVTVPAQPIEPLAPTKSPVPDVIVPWSICRTVWSVSHISWSTIGALNVTGLDAIKDAFEPLLNGQGRNVPNTLEAQRANPDDPLAGADAIEAMIIAEGPEPVAAVYLDQLRRRSRTTR